jgi:transposase
MIDERDKIIEQLRAEIAMLKAYIAELEHRLGLNSTNSGKPPSSDGLGKENAIPKSVLRNRKKNKAARKSRKNQNHLEQVENPDRVIAYQAKNCSNCANDLSSVTSDKHEKRQVFDLPKQAFEVTEHQIHRKICPCCKTKNYGQAPSAVKAYSQYGPNFGAFCIYLNARQLIPYNRIAELSAELFGRKVSEQVIINFVNEFGETCVKNLGEIEANIRKSAVTHADETGLRVKGSLHWMMVSTTSMWTKYWVGKKRGDVVRDLTGILSRDCFAPYDSYNKEARMALCNAHLLRDLEAVKSIAGNEWAGKMQEILLMMNDLKHRYEHYGKDIPENLIKLAIKRYDKLVCEQYKIMSTPPPTNAKKSKLAQKAAALINRLMNRKDDIIRFLVEKDAPFTNNFGERDLRMNKVRQKISGCFRTLDGAHIFAAIRSVIVTWIKQGADVLDSIALAIKSRKIIFPAA